MAEGILRQSYDSTGKRKIYPLTVIDGILRSVDVNVMDGKSRGAYAIIDSMKNYDVDFAKANLTTLNVMARTWNENDRSYSNIVPILSVNDSGFKVGEKTTSTFAGPVKTLYDLQNGTKIEFGDFDKDTFELTPTGRLSTKNEHNVLSGKIELFSNNNTIPFFSVENDRLVWKSSEGKGLSINSMELTYSGSSVVIGDLSKQTSDLTVGRDVSIGRKLNVMSDSSIGGKLYVGGDISFGGTLYANKDASIHNRLYVFDTGYDGSVLLDVSKNGAKISTDTTITKKLTVNGTITATDASTHNLVTPSNELNLAGNISGNSLYFNYRAGSYINQIYMCAGNSTQTSNGNLTKVIAKSLQIGDNNTSYTDSSLLLWTYGEGGSPSIEFRRGAYNDGYTDWRIVSDEGKLKIKYSINGSDYSNSVHFDEGKLYLYGTVSGNTNRYISSDASTNVYVSIDNSIPLVVEKYSIRRDTSPTDLGTSLYPWRTGYFDNIYSNDILSDSIMIQGGKTHMSNIVLYGWYKIGETFSRGVNGPSSNTNIFIVNINTKGNGGSEGYIISFVNDYRYENGIWNDNDSSVHVQITQISGNYGKNHLITKFATICNKDITEYYMYYEGSGKSVNEVYVSCIGTASPISPSKTSKTDADMATGSIFYTDRGAGVRGDFYVNGNYNSKLNGRQYVKISENTISAYTLTKASTLYTGNSPVSISKHLDVYEGITDYSTLTVTGTTNMHNKLTVANGGIDIQNGDASLWNNLIFKNNATNGGDSDHLIKIEQKNNTNRRLYIVTDGLYLEGGRQIDSKKLKANLYVYGSIETESGGDVSVSGKLHVNDGAVIRKGIDATNGPAYISPKFAYTSGYPTMNSEIWKKISIRINGDFTTVCIPKKAYPAMWLDTGGNKMVFAFPSDIYTNDSIVFVNCNGGECGLLKKQDEVVNYKGQKIVWLGSDTFKQHKNGTEFRNVFSVTDI